MSAAVATAIARGNVRCGSRVSPAENVTYCHPSYAQSTAIVATPIPDASDGVSDAGQPSRYTGAPRPNTISARLNRVSVPTFAPVVQFCTVALLRVPRTLM